MDRDKQKPSLEFNRFDSDEVTEQLTPKIYKYPILLARLGCFLSILGTIAGFALIDTINMGRRRVDDDLGAVIFILSLLFGTLSLVAMMALENLRKTKKPPKPGAPPH